MDFDEWLVEELDRDHDLYLVFLGYHADMVARIAEATGRSVEDVNARTWWMVLTKETTPQELFAHVLQGVG